MDMRHARNLVRAQTGNSWLYRAFNWIFAISFAGIVVLTTFFNTNTFMKFQWGWLLLFGAAGVLLAFLLSRLFKMLPTLSRRAEILTVIALFAVYITAQAVAGWLLRVQTVDNWDFGIVYTRAEAWVLQGTMPDDYLLHFANNQGLYVLYCALFSLFHLFGISDFHLPMMVVNMLAINGALLMLYLCGRRLFGNVRSVFLLVCAFLTLPFLLYVPIYYTDTLTLPFPIAIVMLWMKARACWREGNVKGTVVRFLAAGALAALGGLLKVTVLIAFIAVVLDLLILLRGKGRLRLLLGGVALVVGLYIGGTFGMRYLPMMPHYNYNDGIPYTHWIMMGLHGDGGYYDPDYQLTLEQEGMAAREAFTRQEIVARLNEMGPLGVVQHIGHKLSYTFGDGLYTAPLKLDSQPVAASALHEAVVSSGRLFKYTAYYGFAAEVSLLVWMAVGAIKSFFRKNNALTFVRVALFGLTLFLLIWETRARYLVSFMPLFLLCAIEAAPMPLLARQRQRARLDAAGAVPAPAEKAPEEGQDERDGFWQEFDEHYSKAEDEADGAETVAVAAAAAPEELFATPRGEDIWLEPLALEPEEAKPEAFEPEIPAVAAAMPEEDPVDVAPPLEDEGTAAGIWAEPEAGQVAEVSLPGQTVAVYQTPAESADIVQSETERMEQLDLLEVVYGEAPGMAKELPVQQAVPPQNPMAPVDVETAEYVWDMI